MECGAIQINAPPSLISLAVGMPNPDMFPFEEATVKLRNGKSLQISAKQMKTGLQYAPSPGVPAFRKVLCDMQKKIHNLTYEPEIFVTTGSQDGLSKTFEMCMNVNDYVLMEEPSYPGALGILKPYHPRVLALEGDRDGIKPESLRRALSLWKPSDAQTDADMPKILYVIPNGGNPTGTSLTYERKQEIYQIASDYDLLIIEDDPYYFLQFAEKPSPSFLSMDVDGRVMRFDSFSKVLSAGLRVGFMTGPKPLMQRIEYHIQVSLLHTSALAQILILELLKDIGHAGFMDHVTNVRNFYMSQKEKMIAAATKHLKGLAEWNEPTGGMFVWINVPGVKDTSKMISERALKKEVLLAPGNAFLADSTRPSSYVRASYSLASEVELDKHCGSAVKPCDHRSITSVC
ncbi:PREDICTED: kynurenine/alpha-aminoadipate aminotransferase, mitochondrial-like [Priapulus caudatus]|uniref:Kynurenine/alpha-aminoadipate aminotransferase, mitochondrial-like n=1 Tax=Priapulus caudatus TaxID=37621 RepID=A0ABM1DT38_PRICU|nr:PREDICTED: kynurenine/alpha-aminoadipate aminotransferase, mitochondrial-like [Priapulus caudatus]